MLNVGYYWIDKVISVLEEGKDVRLVEWKAADIEILNTFQLLTAKPVVYLVSGYNYMAKDASSIIPFKTFLIRIDYECTPSYIPEW